MLCTNFSKNKYVKKQIKIVLKWANLWGMQVDWNMSHLWDIWQVLMHNCHRPNKGHKTNNGTMHTTTRLPGEQSKCKGEISCIWHGVKHTFGRIIPVRNGGMKSRVWTFLHGMDAPKRRTNKIELSILHKLPRNEICPSLSSRGRTGRTLPQLPNRNDFPTNPEGSGAPTA